jgi:hypothetical protein
MTVPFLTSTDPGNNSRHPLGHTGRALLALLVIAAIGVGGGLLGLLIERPKAIFLILLAMAVWSVSGWFLGGWRQVLAGLAALSTALAASNSNYVLSIALSGLLFIFVASRSGSILHR